MHAPVDELARGFIFAVRRSPMLRGGDPGLWKFNYADVHALPDLPFRSDARDKGTITGTIMVPLIE